MRLREGIHRVEVPTCLPIGQVNVYIFRGEPLTLIDTGPRIPDAYDALKKELRKLDHSINDIGRIIITHGHVDHHGLTEVLRRDSGADVLAPEADAEIIGNFRETYEKRRDRYRDMFLRTGMPFETLKLVEGFFDYLSLLAEATTVSKVVKDGDTLEVGPCQLKAVHTPGHSPGSTCYYDPEGCLFSGDTMIKDVVPVAAFGSVSGESIGLPDYLSSLSRLEKLDVKMVNPGHKADFKDVPAYSALIHSQVEGRQSALLQLLRKEPCTACDLTNRLFGPLGIQDIFLAMTEVMGHLEMLIMEGKIKREEKGDCDCYSLVT